MLVSHNKRPYDVKEAEGIYVHVGAFISVLGERLSE
jgi:hypothetical protein